MSCGARSARGKARRARKAKARALQLLLKLLLSACLHKHEDDLEVWKIADVLYFFDLFSYSAESYCP